MFTLLQKYIKKQNTIHVTSNVYKQQCFNGKCIFLKDANMEKKMLSVFFSHLDKRETYT